MDTGVVAPMPIEAYTRIPLRSRDGSIRDWAIIDPENLEWVNQWRWSLNWGYVIRGETKTGKMVQFRLHRMVMGLTHEDRGLEVDHINHDRLDNRRSNLRIVTRAGNNQNQPSVRGSTSRFRGVSWEQSTRRWVAQAMKDKRTHKIGRFRDEVEAAKAAEAWRAIHFPYAVPDPELEKLRSM
jgi:hypothetical protein